MKTIVFTKLLKSFDLRTLIGFATENGLDGVDLCVRDGYWVEPHRIATDLPPLVKILRGAGLDVPLATVGVTVIPALNVEPVFAACAEARIPLLKLGYWMYKPGPHSFQEQEKEIRTELAVYAKYSQKYGVKPVFHTHSSNYFGCNASSVLRLIEDLNPAHMGVYLDPGHIAICGEPLEMALSMLQGRLAIVAAKNFSYASKPDGNLTRWEAQCCRLNEGIVDWPYAIELLRKSGYDGVINVHAEYHGRHDTASTVEWLPGDLRFMKGLTGKS